MVTISKDGSCRFNASNVAATVTGYVDIKPGDEEDLKAAVATAGPVAVAMDAGNISFQLYSSGDLSIDTSMVIHSFDQYFFLSRYLH